MKQFDMFCFFACFLVFVNWETSNRYVLKNSVGQQVYFAAEESDTCHRQCCGPGRGFVMHITDNMGQVCTCVLTFDIMSHIIMYRALERKVYFCLMVIKLQ